MKRKLPSPRTLQRQLDRLIDQSANKYVDRIEYLERKAHLKRLIKRASTGRARG